MKWVWWVEGVVLAIHDEQLAEHGGAAGGYDHGLLQSALARPRNLAAYKTPDAAALAAAYAFGLIRNHAFVDGNKRTALVAAEVFLSRNGFELTADDAATTMVILEVASGHMNGERLVDWIRENSAPLSRSRPRRKSKKQSP